MMRSPARSRRREPKSWPEMEALLATIWPAGQAKQFLKIRIKTRFSPKSVFELAAKH
jgi:hypothetical protein